MLQDQGPFKFAIRAEGFGGSPHTILESAAFLPMWKHALKFARMNLNKIKDNCLIHLEFSRRCLWASYSWCFVPVPVYTSNVANKKIFPDM